MFDRLWCGKLCSKVCNFINEECQSRQLLELVKEGEEEDKAGMNIFKEHARVRRIVNFVMIVCL